MNNRNSSIGTVLNATLSFRVRYNTLLGQEVRVAGNIEELGSWELSKAIPMTTSPELYPYWTSTQEITGPVGMEMHYKYVIYDNNTKQFIWENDNETNRCFVISVPGCFEINDEQGNKETKLRKVNDINYIYEYETDDSYDVNSNNYCDLLSYNIYKTNSNLNDYSFLSPLSDLTLKLSSYDKLIIVTEFLPFDIIKHNDNVFELKQNDNNMIYTLLYFIKQKNICDVIWISMIHNANSFSYDDLEDIYEYLKENNVYIVNVDIDVYMKYHIYVNKILKRVFIHNSYNNNDMCCSAYEIYFDAYYVVNQLFAKKIANVCSHKTDLIMLNDVNFMFVPNFLLQKNVNIQLGMYMHSPFPSCDVFKMFPHCNEILKSMLLCDVIGFHNTHNALNFLNSVDVLYNINYEIQQRGFITLKHNGKDVIINIKHVGIEKCIIKDILNKDEYKSYMNTLQSKYLNKYTFITIDNAVDITDNICYELLLLKLKAFIAFAHSANANNVQMIQLVKVMSNEDELVYNKLYTYVNDVNNGNGLIHIEKCGSEDVVKRVALFSIGNAFVYLPLGCGYCMYVNEYICIQNEMKDNNKQFGCVLSENCGVCKSIKGIHYVNVYNVNSIINGFKCVFNMKQSEKEMFINENMNYLNRNNIYKWITSFFIDIKRINNTNEDVHSFIKVPNGFGLNFEIMKLKCKEQFKYLTKHNIIKYYKRSKRRIILLSYNDTNNNNMSNIISYLKQLAYNNEHNKVYIVYTYNENTMNKYLNDVHYVDKLLIGKIECNSVVSMLIGVKKDNVNNICNCYCEHVNEVVNVIKASFEVSDVEYQNDSVNVHIKDVNKGYCVSLIMQKEFEEEIDLIMCFGVDDNDDDDIFKYLSYCKQKFKEIQSKCEVVSCVVGKKYSHADYYVYKEKELIDILRDIVKM